MGLFMSTEWFKVASIDTIPVNEGKRVYYGDYDIGLFNLGHGGFAAIDNQCPHKKGPLSDGIVSGDAVVCPLHGWKVSIKTGCVLGQGPRPDAVMPQVRVYPTKVIGNDVYVAFNEWRFHSPEEPLSGEPAAPVSSGVAVTSVISNPEKLG